MLLLSVSCVRIHPVPQTVSHQVNSEGCEEDSRARDGCEPPKVQHIRSSFSQHAPPGSHGWWNSQPQETKKRLPDDHTGQLESCQNDDGAGQVRHDVFQNHSAIPSSQSPRGGYEIPSLYFNDFRPYQACINWPPSQAQNHDHILITRAGGGHDRNRQKDIREGHHDVYAVADDTVQEPAEISRKDSKGNPYQARKSHGQETYREGDAGPIDQSAKQVSAYRVGSQCVPGISLFHPKKEVGDGPPSPVPAGLWEK